MGDYLLQFGFSVAPTDSGDNDSGQNMLMILVEGHQGLRRLEEDPDFHINVPRSVQV